MGLMVAVGIVVTVFLMLGPLKPKTPSGPESTVSEPDVPRAKLPRRTYEDFKKSLQVGTVSGISIEALHRTVGRPARIEMIGDEVFLYYPIREGVLQIVGDRWHWENDEAITGYTREGHGPRDGEIEEPKDLSSDLPAGFIPPDPLPEVGTVVPSESSDASDGSDVPDVTRSPDDRPKRRSKVLVKGRQLVVLRMNVISR